MTAPSERCWPSGAAACRPRARARRAATLLDDDGPLVAVVHGVAGSGKSALLRAFSDRGGRARRRRRPRRRPRDRADAARLLAAVAEAVAAAADGPLVLVIDTAERLRLLDGWLRLTLPARRCPRTRASCSPPATRPAPSGAPRSASCCATVPLGPLAPGGRGRGAARAGLDETQAAWVNRFVRGHPLSLQLAASAIRERPDAPEDAVLPTVVQELAGALPRRARPGDARGARRHLRAAPRHALAARRAAAGRAAAGGVRAARGAAVRRARPRGPGDPRHRPRGRRRAAARDRPGAPSRVPRGGLAADPRASSPARPARPAGPRSRT